MLQMRVNTRKSVSLFEEGLREMFATVSKTKIFNPKREKIPAYAGN